MAGHNLVNIRTAYIWNSIRNGKLAEALQYTLQLLEETRGQDEDNHIMCLGMAGMIYEGTGDFEKSLHFNKLCFDKTYARYERNPMDEGNIMHLNLACLTLASLYQKLSKFEDAYYLYKLMYEICSRLLSANPGNLAVLKSHMIACQNLADLFLRQNSPKQAFPFCTEYKNCLGTLELADPDDLDVKNKLNISNILLGDCYVKMDNTDAALESYREALAGASSVSTRFKKFEELQKYADLQATLALAYEKLGDLYNLLGNPGAAYRHNIQNREILKRLVEKHPENLTFQYNMMVCLQNMGTILYEQEDFVQALDYFEQCNALATRLIHLTPDFVHLKGAVANIYQYQGKIYTALGQLTLALTYYQAMYSQLSDIASLNTDDPRVLENFAFGCHALWTFMNEELKDRNAIRYLKESNRLYAALVEKYPLIEEYREKAERVAKDLSNALNNPFLK